MPLALKLMLHFQFTYCLYVSIQVDIKLFPEREDLKKNFWFSHST